MMLSYGDMAGSFVAAYGEVSLTSAFGDDEPHPETRARD